MDRRRIRGVMCRYRGADRTIDVGGAIEGQTVIEILQAGREGFTVHCEDAAVSGRRSTIEIAGRTVYSVTEFDA